MVFVAAWVQKGRHFVVVKAKHPHCTEETRPGDRVQALKIAQEEVCERALLCATCTVDAGLCVLFYALRRASFFRGGSLAEID